MQLLKKMAGITSTLREGCRGTSIDLNGIPAAVCANCDKIFDTPYGAKRRNIFGVDSTLSFAGFTPKDVIERMLDVTIVTQPSQRSVFVCYDCFSYMKSFAAGDKRCIRARQNFQNAGTHGLLAQRAKKSSSPPMTKAPGVQLSSVKETGKRKRSDEDTPDAAVESLTPVYLHSQLSRWKGACNNLELTDNQMAKFLLDRYYKGDKSVSAFSGSTHKTLLLDRELLTLWNDSKAAKGFSSDVDFLWFLLLGPQKSGTDSEGCTVRDHRASEECVPVKVDYVGPGYTASDTSQDSNANHPLISQPPTCIPSPTQNNYITETAMITQVPVTSQNNEMQMPRHKKSRKQVLEELSQDDPVFPESFGKEGSRCDHVDTAPTQQELGRTENHTSTPYMATQRSNNTTSRAKSRKQVNPQPGPREKPAKDLGNFENTTTCSKPTSGEVGIDLKEEEELETDPSDCDHRSTTCITSQLSFATGGIRVKQEGDHNHSMSSQLSRDSAVSIKVEKEDGLKVNLSNFDKTNESCPQLGANIKEEDKNTIDYENTNTPQLSHSTVSIKVEKEDGLEIDLGCYGNTNTSSHQSLEEELEMQLDSAIMATSKHLG